MAGSSGPHKKIIIKRIAHTYYKYADLNKAVQFLEDFGFTEEKRVSDDKIYFRGYGTEPWVVCAITAGRDEFGGVAYVVESEDDLRLAAETLPGASAVYELEDAPGGGKCVTFPDPVDGFPFHLVWDQETAAMLDVPLPHEAVNYVSQVRFCRNFTNINELYYKCLANTIQPTEKNRPVNKTQRFKKRPAPVHKLGHWGHCTTNFPEAFEFYTSRFNFIPSDVSHPSSASSIFFPTMWGKKRKRKKQADLTLQIVHNAEGVDITTFLRLDRGAEQVDHHCFFFYQGPKFHVHHSSYETHDFDTQVLGHDWLREKGYKNCWGVGRHVLGSQIFDYW